MPTPTWTEHKLTTPQLRILSGIVNGRKHKHGMPLVALLNKRMAIELVEERPRPYGLPSAFVVVGYEATEAGVQALKQARAEGW